MSSLAVPGSAATPCVAQLVLSTQKAEPQDAWEAPAAGSSASPQTIANGFFIFSSPQIPIRAPGSGALQISEGTAGTLGLASASSGQNALSAMPASASQAAVRRRKRNMAMAA